MSMKSSNAEGEQRRQLLGCEKNICLAVSDGVDNPSGEQVASAAAYLHTEEETAAAAPAESRGKGAEQ